MSAQASKAARELAENFRQFLSEALGIEVKWTEQGERKLPEMIQAHLADLLEKAQAMTDEQMSHVLSIVHFNGQQHGEHDTFDHPSCVGCAVGKKAIALAKSLEPWKARE